ncbi:MAG TPA: outer membrane beta-barrel protein [Nitrospirota bacterium]|nr:outer membrane beta-barrel protein [Nitrospirota bacterium]
MKHIIIACLAVILAFGPGTAAFAKSGQASAPGDAEVDGSLVLSTGPGDYDGGVGINFGAGYALASVDRNLQARVDLSYLQFKKDYPWGTGDYSRVPIILSARYYLPPFDKLRFFGQAGVITSIDTYDTSSRESKREIRIGLAPAVGVEFMINPKFGFFAMTRAHLITDSYMSMHFGVAAYY